MVWSEWLSIFLAVATVLFAYLAFARSRKKDTQDEAAVDASVQATLLDIKKSTDEIKEELKEQRRMNLSISCEITEIRESVKQAHKRIDSLERKVEKGA